jgi:hypothetical protein
MKTKKELKCCDPGNESCASLRLTFRQPKTEPCPRQLSRRSKSIERRVEGAWRDVKKAETACEYLKFLFTAVFEQGESYKSGIHRQEKAQER